MEIYSIRFSACKYSENSWFSTENTANHFLVLCSKITVKVKKFHAVKA